MLILSAVYLYPFGLTVDQMTFWGFIAGVVAAVGVIVTIILTIYFGKKSLTKTDLAPIEGNTAHLEDVKASLTRIDKRDALDALAHRVAITVSGQGDIPQPLTISLTLTNPSVTVERIQLFNEHGNLFGSADCEKANELVYTATLDFPTVQSWFLGGTAVGTTDRMRLSVKV